ncbi:MAG: AAA family ATPase [Lachnospiraceae bacterium]|nr:AAA family ATPase [Lachnospiraceae bacterium]
MDKSGIIEKINQRINTKNRFLCITRPRRFGKTSVLNMLGAYCGSAYSAESLFGHLNISRKESCQVHLNK